jgi:hypothetical protein
MTVRRFTTRLQHFTERIRTIRDAGATGSFFFNSEPVSASTRFFVGGGDAHTRKIALTRDTIRVSAPQVLLVDTMLDDGLSLSRSVSFEALSSRTARVWAFV